METKTIRVFAKDIKTAKTTFQAYLTKINNVWYTVKFGRDCQKPDTKGVYDITLDPSTIGLQDGGTYTTADGEVKNKDKILWINEYLECLDVTEQVREEQKKNAIAQVFGK